jgi:hypothetical protein
MRAASPGLNSERLRSAVRYAGYELPPGAQSSASDAAAAPVRLALLSGPDTGRVLCHACAAGNDPSTGRHGNFFAHMLLDLPETCDALALVRTWGSTFWRKADGDYPNELPDIEALPDSAELNEPGFHRFLSAPERRSLFRFAVGTFLCGDSPRRIYLGACAEDVAWCLFGLCRALPRGLLRDFTFSTYEGSPLNCSARVVGAWPGNADLPDACYSASGYNSASGRQTPMPALSYYADFVFARVSEDRWKELDAFNAFCDGLELKDTAAVDLACRRKHAGAALSVDDLRCAARAPKLCRWLAEDATILDRIFAEAAEDTSFGQSVVPVYLSALAVDPVSRARFVEGGIDALTVALRSGKTARFCHLFELGTACFTGAEAAQMRNAVWQTGAGLRALPWDLRAYLLPRLAAEIQACPASRPERRGQWLAVETEYLDECLDLELPAWMKQTVVTECLRREPSPGAKLIQLLGGRISLLMELVRNTVPGSADAALVDAAVAGLIEDSHGADVIWALLDEANSVPPDRFRECLRGVFARAGQPVVAAPGEAATTRFFENLIAALERESPETLSAKVEWILEATAGEELVALFPPAESLLNAILAPGELSPSIALISTLAAFSLGSFQSPALRVRWRKAGDGERTQYLGRGAKFAGRIAAALPSKIQNALPRSYGPWTAEAADRWQALLSEAGPSRRPLWKRLLPFVFRMLPFFGLSIHFVW